MTSLEILYKEGSNIRTRMSDIPITGSSHAVGALMESDYIELAFVSPNPVFFEIGDYIDFADSKYNELHLYPSLRKKYIVKDKQVPTYVPSNDVYEYKLRLDAYYWQWNNRVFKYKPASFGQEASWSLTGNVSGFMDLFVSNLQTYGLGTFSYQIDQGANYNIYLSFDGTLMIDALNMIVSAIKDAYNTEVEWWVVGNTIHIGDCRIGTNPVTVTDEGNNKNAVSIKPKDADTDYANRLIVFGGTQNLSARYRKQLWFTADTVNGSIISDSVRKLFSPSWFKTSERVYKAAIQKSFQTQWINNAWMAEDYVNYSGGSSLTTQVEHIIESRTFGASTISIDYSIQFGLCLAGKNVPTDSDGHPLMEAAEADPLYWSSAIVKLIATCVETEEKIEIDRKEYKSRYNQNIIDISSYLCFSGTFSAVNTDFVDKTWQFKVVISGTVRQPEGQGTIYTYTAGYSLASSTLSYKSDYVYKVCTTIKLADGSVADCEINPDYNDIYSDEARNIKVIGLSISQGQKYTFPNIVRGRVTPGYFTAEVGDTNVNSVVQRNLMLPESFSIKYGSKGEISISSEAGSVAYSKKNYIDAKSNISAGGIVERIIVFDEIFPRMKDATIDMVGSYTTEAQAEESSVQTIIDQEGEVKKKHIFYQIVDNDLPFTEDCLLENEQLKVSFQTGKLAGMTFEVAYAPNKDVFGDDPNRFEIVANEEYGIELPNDLAYPQTGDKYILTGWNVEAMEGQGNLISSAETELLQEAVKLLSKMVHDPHAYDVSLMSDAMCDEQTTIDICLGRSISLKNTFIFPTDIDNKRDMRIVAYDVKLDIPFDTPSITVGESQEYSVLKAIERSAGKKEQSIAVYASGSGGTGGSGGSGGSGTSWDNITEKPDTLQGYGIVDVYIQDGVIHIGGTSLKPLTEFDYEQIEAMIGDRFLSKKYDDVAEGHITFNKGLTSNAAAAFKDDISVDGTAYTQDIDNNNKITTKDLEVSGTAHFFEVVIDKIRATRGIEMLSPASARIDIVQKLDDTRYKLLFLAQDADGRAVTNDFVVGDQLYHQTFNLRVGTSYNASNRYYWVACTESNNSSTVKVNGRDYWYIVVDFNNSDSRSISRPAVDDEIVVLGNQDSVNHAARQNTILFASIECSWLNLRRPDPVKNGAVTSYPRLSPPMMVQLQGINTFVVKHPSEYSTSNYGNIISRGYNSLSGVLHSSDGDTSETIKVENLDAQDTDYLCTSDFNAPGASASGWAKTYTASESFPYIWKRVLHKYSDNTEKYTVEFVNKFVKGDTGAAGTDGQDGYTPIKNVDYFDGKDGKDGKGIDYNGDNWSTALVAQYGGAIPKLTAVRMGRTVYICVNENGTANPPLWCYKDASGNYLTYNDGGYMLTGEANEDEWEKLTESGADGKDGRDGYTPIKGIDYFDGEDGYTPVKGVDYFDGNDGADGIGVKYINVFKRGNVEQMATPTGGTFDSPIPSGWSDGIPSGEEKCWVSTRPFYSDGRASSWCKPVVMTDTADFDCAFSTDTTQPPAPTNHGVQSDAHWHNTPREGDRWMATSVKHNGEWSTWQITKILGEDGDPSYIHTAYCNNISTWADFTVSNPSGRSYNYVGTYTDHTLADSTDPTKYKWVYVKGDKGDDGSDITMAGEWHEGMTIEPMTMFRYKGVTYLYIGETAWSGYPHGRYLDYQGNVLRYSDGGLVFVDDACAFDNRTLFQIVSSDSYMLKASRQFAVAGVNGDPTQSVFTFKEAQSVEVQLMRGNSAVDEGVTFSINATNCTATLKQLAGVAIISISTGDRVTASRVPGYDYYLPSSDCSIEVLAKYEGQTYSLLLPIQIDYSSRWGEFVHDREKFKSDIMDLQVADGVMRTNISSIDQKADRIDLKVDSNYSDLNGRVNTASTAISQHATAIGNMQTAEASMSAKITDNETAIDGVKTRMTTAESSITTQATKIGELTTAQATMSSKISTTETDVSKLKNAVGDDSKGLTKRMIEAESSITTQAKDIKNLTSTSAAMESSITVIDGEIAEINEDIEATQIDLETAQSDIEAAKKDIKTAQAKIETSVQYNKTTGELTSSILMKGDKVHIDTTNFKVNGNGEVYIAGYIHTKFTKISASDVMRKFSLNGLVGYVTSVKPSANVSLVCVYDSDNKKWTFVNGSTSGCSYLKRDNGTWYFINLTTYSSGIITNGACCLYNNLNILCWAGNPAFDIALPTTSEYEGARAIIMNSTFSYSRSTLPPTIRAENGSSLIVGQLSQFDNVTDYKTTTLQQWGGSCEYICFKDYDNTIRWAVHSKSAMLHITKNGQEYVV